MVILDLGLPRPSGLDTLAEIRRRYPQLPVLILSGYPEKQFALRALKAGADGYLNKSSSPGQLVQAIRQVLTGRRYIGPDAVEILDNALTKGLADHPRQERLSDCEFMVMRKIAVGKTVADMRWSYRSAVRP